jgi:hypothetical protein
MVDYNYENSKGNTGVKKIHSKFVTHRAIFPLKNGFILHSQSQQYPFFMAAFLDGIVP